MRIQRRLDVAAILLLGMALVLIAAIVTGLFDPAPAGSLLRRRSLTPLSVDAGSRRVVWLDEAVPDAPLTVRVAAAHQAGEQDAGYGIILDQGMADEALAIAVSPLGYVSIWHTAPARSEETQDFLLPWQTWPHVRGGQETNEIWVDVRDNRATVRVNREWLWEGELSGTVQAVGLWAESFGREVTVDFQSLELFAGEA